MTNFPNPFGQASAHQRHPDLTEGQSVSPRCCLGACQVPTREECVMGLRVTSLTFTLLPFTCSLFVLCLHFSYGRIREERNYKAFYHT